MKKFLGIFFVLFSLWLCFSSVVIVEAKEMRTENEVLIMKKGQEFSVADDLPWYLPISNVVKDMSQEGIGFQYIWLFLSLPIIITLIVMARQLIGIYSVDIYVPTLLSSAFLILGLQKGIFFFFMMLLAVVFIRLLVKRVKILYMPSIALTIVLLNFALFFLVYYLGKIDFYIIGISSIMPLLVILMSSEKFLSLHFKYDSRKAWFTILETMLVVLSAYFLVSWSWLQAIVFSYPDLILLLVPVLIILGRLKGLRLLEYRRFYQIIHKEAQEDFDDLLIN